VRRSSLHRTCRSRSRRATGTRRSSTRRCNRRSRKVQDGVTAGWDEGFGAARTQIECSKMDVGYSAGSDLIVANPFQKPKSQHVRTCKNVLTCRTGFASIAQHQS